MTLLGPYWQVQILNLKSVFENLVKKLIYQLMIIVSKIVSGDRN